MKPIRLLSSRRLGLKPVSYVLLDRLGLYRLARLAMSEELLVQLVNGEKVDAGGGLLEVADISGTESRHRVIDEEGYEEV